MGFYSLVGKSEPDEIRNSFISGNLSGITSTFTGGHAFLAAGNDISRNGAGFSSDQTAANSFVGNNIHDNGIGLAFSMAVGYTIAYNSIHDNDIGILLDLSSGASIATERVRSESDRRHREPR